MNILITGGTGFIGSTITNCQIELASLKQLTPDFASRTLHIKDVQKEDKGFYMCQVNTDPMVSTVGFLDVVGKLPTNFCLQFGYQQYFTMRGIKI